MHAEPVNSLLQKAMSQKIKRRKPRHVTQGRDFGVLSLCTCYV